MIIAMQVACVSTIPTHGACQLKSNRENRALLNTDREHELLKPANETSREKAVESEDAASNAVDAVVVLVAISRW